MTNHDGIISKRKAADSPLITQMTTAMAHGVFPLIVTEGTSQSKVARIDSNVYLKAAWRVFKSVHGYMFIFGHSLCEQDQHLLDAIVQNQNLQAIFVGLHGDIDSATNREIVFRAINLRKRREGLVKQNPAILPLRVEFFQSETAPVWK